MTLNKRRTSLLDRWHYSNPLARFAIVGAVVGTLALVLALLTACARPAVSTEDIGCVPDERHLDLAVYTLRTSVSDMPIPGVQIGGEFEGVPFQLEMQGRGIEPEQTGWRIIVDPVTTITTGAPVYSSHEETTWNEMVVCVPSDQPFAMYMRATVTIPGLDSTLRNGPEGDFMLTYDMIECAIADQGNNHSDDDDIAEPIVGKRRLEPADYVGVSLRDDLHIGVQCNYEWTPPGWTGAAVQPFGSISEETGGTLT